MYYQNSKTVSGSNSIGTMMKVIGYILYILGFIAGIVVGSTGSSSYYYAYTSSYSWGAAVGIWVGAFIGGTSCLALGEIISLLQKMVNLSVPPVYYPPQPPYSAANDISQYPGAPRQ